MPVCNKYFYRDPSFLFFFLFIFLLQKINLQAQQFNSDQEIKKFADFLFCEKDYLRSIQEYRRLNGFSSDANLQRKIGVAFLKMEKYDSASVIFSQLSLTDRNNFVEEINLLKIKTDLLKKDYFLVNDFKLNFQNDSIKQSILKLKYFSRLLTFEELPAQINFTDEETAKVSNLISHRDNLNFKSPTLAAALSVIPGLGKIYTENYGDAIYAFLFSGIFAFLAYDNFSAKHYARGWIFSAVTLGYYGGNIYGAAASALLYNARIKAEFEVDVNSFLKEKNYFVPPNLEFECEK